MGYFQIYRGVRNRSLLSSASGGEQNNPFPDPCCHSEFLILPETHFSFSYVTQALFSMVVVVVLVVLVVEVVVVVGCGGAVGSGRGSVMVEASKSSIVSRHESTFSSMKLFMNPKIRVSTYTKYSTNPHKLGYNQLRKNGGHPTYNSAIEKSSIRNFKMNCLGISVVTYPLENCIFFFELDKHQIISVINIAVANFFIEHGNDSPFVVLDCDVIVDFKC